MPPPSLIRPAEAAEYLRRMLANAGFNLKAPDLALAWRTFKEFASVPVVCDQDSLLFQCGVFTFTGRPEFHFDFTRQFGHEVDGEHSHMEQLNFTLYYVPTDALKKLQTNLWSHDCASLHEFFSRVERLPAFTTVRHTPDPVRAEVHFGDV